MQVSWLGRLLWVWLCALCACGTCLTLARHHGPTRALARRQTSPRLVYRGDDQTPENVKAQGGFLLRDISTRTVQGYSLLHHVEDWSRYKQMGKLDEFDSLYVSTTTDPITAGSFAASDEDYVYCIKTTPNAVDVNESYRKKKLTPKYESEKEIAFLGGISYSQIVSWRKKGEIDWKANPDYNEDFDTMQGGDAEPELLEVDLEKAKKAALRILASDAFVEAKKAGAAPSWCTAGLKSRSEGDSCVPRYDADKQRSHVSKWASRTSSASTAQQASDDGAGPNSDGSARPSAADDATRPPVDNGAETLVRPPVDNGAETLVRPPADDVAETPVRAPVDNGAETLVRPPAESGGDDSLVRPPVKPGTRPPVKPGTRPPVNPGTRPPLRPADDNEAGAPSGSGGHDPKPPARKPAGKVSSK